jgi:hypothetical protein
MRERERERIFWDKTMNGINKSECVLGGLCLGLFIAAQTFQEVAYRFWIPASHGPRDDLLIYLLPIDRARAILILSTIILLIVPFVVIALRCFKAASMASLLGLIFGVAFIAFEISRRSLDFFVVGQEWANQFILTNSAVERDSILQRFALWNEMARGWFFPLMLSYFLSSCSFAVATWKDREQTNWRYLAPIAFALNALRLVGRLLNNYAGQKWLDGLNGTLYFPAVLTVDMLLIMWFFFLARHTAGESVTNGAMVPAPKRGEPN